MIDTVIHSADGTEMRLLEDQLRHAAARLGEEALHNQCFPKAQMLLDYLAEGGTAELACLDVSEEGGVRTAESARRRCEQALLLLLADTAMSPMEYLKPSIMAGALLLRPYTGEQAAQILRETLRKLLRDRAAEEPDEKTFRIETRDGIRRIPFSQIYFFEARQRKVIVSTGGQEFSFYDTIDGLEKRLPDSFVRCHRSFIIARAKIDKIYLAKNYITLEDGEIIPLSRTYKAAIKELR